MSQIILAIYHTMLRMTLVIIVVCGTQYASSPLPAIEQLPAYVLGCGIAMMLWWALQFMPRYHWGQQVTQEKLIASHGDKHDLQRRQLEGGLLLVIGAMLLGAGIAMWGVL